MFFRPLLDLFFPPLCHACKSFIPEAGEIFLCADCLERIGFIASPLCTVCGAPFATDNGTDHTCGACTVNAPSFTCRSAAVLAGPLQELIHRFKYGGRVQLGHPLGLLAASALASFCAEAAPDLVIPVPLHKKRLRERGYNQSQLIGNVLRKKLALRQEVGNLCRVRWTEPQTTLDAKDRVDNVRGAFAVCDAKRLKGKRVLLVDDVLTTGSTMRACAEALHEAEVAAIFAVTVARGVR